MLFIKRLNNINKLSIQNNFRKNYENKQAKTRRTLASKAAARRLLFANCSCSSPISIARWDINQAVISPAVHLLAFAYNVDVH